MVGEVIWRHRAWTDLGGGIGMDWMDGRAQPWFGWLEGVEGSKVGGGDGGR